MALRNYTFLLNVHRNISGNLLRPSSPSNCLIRNSGSFKYSDLVVTLGTESQLSQKPDPSELRFGVTYSDHMFEVEWTDSDGWGTPKILPVHSLHLHPGAKVLHYAQAVFEGMKAFKYSNGQVGLFRPDMNMKRLWKTSQRACLPDFDTDELLKCIKKLVYIEKDWIPNRELCSLYVRPNFIGIENTLGIASSKKALLYVVNCPVGGYFQSAIQPISLLADPKYVRACPGGVGEFKMASNYAPTLYIQKIAQDQKMDQVLWLLGDQHHITEAGGMNVFFVLKNSNGEIELVTPSLDGTILPGVVRQSVLDLGRKWKEFSVSERPITMNEIINAQKKGCLLEMFASGTAASICPVKLIRYNNQDIKIPTMETQNPLYNRFLQTIVGIQYGRIKSDWSVPVNDD